MADKQLAGKLADIFQGFSKRFGQYTVQKINEVKNKHEGKAITLDRGPALEDYQAHIDGTQRMGIVPLMDDGSSIRFAAIDIDVYPDGDNKNEIIDKVVDAIGELPLFVTRSKSGGCHVWLLAKEPVPAALAYRAMKEIAGELGYGNAEIFPKQTKRVDDEDVGNWINLPYYGSICKCRMQKEEDRSVFFDVELEGFVEMVEQVSQDWVEKWLATYDYNPLDTSNVKRASASTEDFIDGPPCLQSIIRGWQADGSVPSGNRNEMLFDIGLYYLRKYEIKETVQSRLIELDAGRATMDGKPIPGIGLGEKEIRGTVMKTLFKKDYHYRCNRDQLKQHCKAGACRKLAFGVEGTDEAMLPNAITIYQYGPLEKVYYLSLSNFDSRLGPLKDEIGSFESYRKAVRPLIDAIPRKMAAGEWENHINGLLQLAKKNIVVVDNVSETDRFIEKLREWVFMTGTTNEQRMITGRPYLEDGVLKFTSSALTTFVKEQVDSTMPFERIYDFLMKIDPNLRRDKITFDHRGDFDAFILDVKNNNSFKRGELDASISTDTTPF